MERRCPVVGVQHCPVVGVQHCPLFLPSCTTIVWLSSLQVQIHFGIAPHICSPKSKVPPTRNLKLRKARTNKSTDLLSNLSFALCVPQFSHLCCVSQCDLQSCPVVHCTLLQAFPLTHLPYAPLCCHCISLMLPGLSQFAVVCSALLCCAPLRGAPHQTLHNSQSFAGRRAGHM